MSDTNTAESAVILIVVLGVLITIGTWGTAAALEGTANETEITNETVEQSGDWQLLEADGDRYEDPHVEYDGQTLEEGVDYEFNRSDGAIRFADTENTEEGEDASVDYVAIDYPEQAQSFASVFAPLWEIGGLLPFISAAGAMLAGVGYLQKARGRW